MGAVGGGGEDKKAVQTAAGKTVWKRRLGIRIDMTPMVDIVFLLLIFYMVTTVFAMPQAMEVNLPDETGEIPTPDAHVLSLRVDADGRLWVNLGRKVPDLIDMDTLRAILIAENQAEPKLATVIAIHPDSKYHWMVDILDDIDVVERRFQEVQGDWSYRFTMKPWDDDDDRAVAKASEHQLGA